MRRFSLATVRCALILVIVAASAARAAQAQIGVSFTPSSGSWLAGTQVGVTIKFCANPEQWYLSHWITFNGVDVTGSFSSASGSDGSCVLLQYWSGTVTLASGTNTLSAGFTAAYFDGADVYYETSFSNSAYYTGTAPPVDVPALEDYGRCAVSCFAATYAQGTVPYFSLDTPRNVTLVYNGDRVDPKPFVHVDYTISGTLPSWLQLRVRRVGGADITFVNGETALRFSAPATGTWRLGGQFNATANGMSTGAYLVEVIVGQMIGGNLQETVVETRRLIVVNENSSPVARGWTLAGVQRLYPISGGGALITEGDGSAVYFAWNGSAFVAPAGEFSRLTGSGGWVRAYPDSTKVTFNVNGYMTSVADRFGNATNVGYTGSNVTAITDPQGIVQTLGYGSYGLASITALGRTTTVSVPSSSRLLTAITDPDNVATQFGYDGSFRLSSVTDRAGATTTLGYDAQSGKLSVVTAPGAPIFNEGFVNPVASLAAWHEVSVPYGYTNPPSGSPLTPVATSQIQATVTDAGNHATSFTVNHMGQPLVTTPAVGAGFSVSYTSAFLPTVVTHPTGVRDTTLYNADGLPTYVRPWGQTATTIFYTAGRWAQPDSSKGVSQPTVINRIGVNGRIDTVKVNGNATAFTYDTRGRVVSRRDPSDHVVSTVFDGVNGNRGQGTVPGNRTIRYYQDALGRDTAVVAPERPRARAVYDVLNRVIEQYDSAGASPTRSWWGALRLDSLGDPVGYRYRFSYNAVGWVTRRTDAAGAWDSLRYDRDGHVRSWTNRRGQTVTHAYDALHRPTAKSGDSTATESWSYSSDGRVLTATSPVATETIYLDSALRRLDSARTVMAGQTYWRRYLYTAAGLLDSAWTTGGSVTFAGRRYLYNSTGALTDIRLSGLATHIDRNGEDLISQITLPSGRSVARAYNGLHAASAVNATSGSPAGFYTAVFSGAAYDSLGRIVREIRNVEGTGMGVDYAGYGYTYDRLGRLRAESTIVNSSPPPSCDGGMIVDEYGNSCVSGAGWVATGGTTFSYDAVGNRTDRGGTYTTGNRIQAFDGCTYTTSPDGNVTARSGACLDATFAWLADGRLGRITAGGATFTFHYDATGRLVRRDSNGVVNRHFLWDGDNLLAELDAAGTARVAEYSYWGLDRLHALIKGNTAYYAHQDARGNTQALTDTVTPWRDYRWGAWGTLTGGGDALPFSGADRARWKGALWMSPELDLYYMRNRWYEPRTGRFLSEDPIGLAGGTNLYAFANDDPVNGSDPTGLCALYLITFIDWNRNGMADAGEVLAWECFIGGLDETEGGSGAGTGPGSAPSPEPPTWSQCFRAGMRVGAETAAAGVALLGAGATWLMARGSELIQEADHLLTRSSDSFRLFELNRGRGWRAYVPHLEESQRLAARSTSREVAGGLVRRSGQALAVAAAAITGYALGVDHNCRRNPRTYEGM